MNSACLRVALAVSSTTLYLRQQVVANVAAETLAARVRGVLVAPATRACEVLLVVGLFVLFLVVLGALVLHASS